MKKRYLSPILIVLTVFGIVLIGSGYRRSGASQPNAPTELEVELITLRAYGFEPTEITRPKGPFVLFVEDRSGRSDSSLRLQRVKGERLRDVNTTRMKSEWHDVVNLPAGEYLLLDGNNPEARCQITILP